MCLGLPGQIIEIKGATAVVDCWGQRQDVVVDGTTNVEAGDYVITHDGAIVRRLDPAEAFEVLSMYEMVLPEA